MEARAAAKTLKEMAMTKFCRFPKIWDETKILQECGKTILLYKKDDGTFDFDEALEYLIEKYGVEKPAVKEEEIDLTSTPTKKRTKAKRAAEETVEEDEDIAKKKKLKKSETFVVEENRGVGEAIYEMASIYFKNKDARKGGVFSKAAKAIRECDFHISDMKSAMSLPGVGKGIASYMQEFFDSGTITKLEEMRAGMA